MHLKTILSRITDNLDSIQVFVTLREVNGQIQIVAKNEGDRLLAKKEVARTGLPVALPY